MNRTIATLHFTELLHTLLKGNTGLVDALYILSRAGIEKPVQDCASAVLFHMKKGRGFSESMRIMENGKIYFEPLYLTLVNAAELTGNIEDVLGRIIDDLRRKQRTKETVLNIIIYPVIIVVLAIVGTAVILLKAMPVFIASGFLADTVLHEVIRGIFFAGLVLLCGGITIFTVYFRIFYIDSPEFKIFYLLDFLIHGNVSLPDALAQCIAAMGTTRYAATLVAIRQDVTKGVAFSRAFSKTGRFSSYVLGWLSVADNNGDAGEICGHIKDYYAVQDTRKREVASRLIEPSVIVLTGIYLFIIMVTVIVPILTYTGGLI